MNHNLDTIQATALKYSQARESLAGIVALIEAETAAVYAASAKALRRAVNDAKTFEAKLTALVEANPGEFAKPKTHTFHGIKVGYRKGTGALEWEDDADVVKLIKKHFPELADAHWAPLIHTEETPVKSALQQLRGELLKKLGITVEDTGDVVIVKPTDTNVDKIVKALLKKSPEETA